RCQCAAKLKNLRRGFPSEDEQGICWRETGSKQRKELVEQGICRLVGLGDFVGRALASFRKTAATSGCPRTASRDWRSPFVLFFFVLPFAEPHAGATAVFVDEFHASALEGAHDRRKGRGITRVAAGFNIGHRVAVDLSGLGEVAHAPI